MIQARRKREDTLTDGQQTRGADMMGLDNPIHIAFLLIVLLLVFGAKRLPEMGHSLGTGLRGFKDAIGGESTHLSLGAHEQSQPQAQPVNAQPVQAVEAQPNVAQPTGPQPAAAQPVPVVPMQPVVHVASVPDNRAA
ncbi:MAG: twin-arginine translocase TatA/TatE family subunit [Solirubrobacteraceae bacterium]